MTDNELEGASLETTKVIEPSPDLMGLTSGDWATPPSNDPIVQHLTESYWPHDEEPDSWEAARFSRAVYVYRERVTCWPITVKFYAAKTGQSATKYAEREFNYIQQVRDLGFSGGTLRAIQPIGSWQGVLFLEYVEGLSLADLIAVRNTFPGKLRSGLQAVAELLAKLHNQCAQPDVSTDFEGAIKDQLRYLRDLAKHGVLKHETRIIESIEHMVNEWATHPLMSEYTPTLIHGDATTTNFVILGDGTVVGLDWERLKTADPASDLGRLAAEVIHSMRDAGGDSLETEALLQNTLTTYSNALPESIDASALRIRINFYQAMSLLRIARNGWVPRLDRMTLVAHAMALLAEVR
ncbi:MAG: phosphotransferase [Anaerolineales bacterium]|nr:phosphotransferase [Anaerolineales bacterium]